MRTPHEDVSRSSLNSPPPVDAHGESWDAPWSWSDQDRQQRELEQRQAEQQLAERWRSGVEVSAKPASASAQRLVMRLVWIQLVMACGVALVSFLVAGWPAAVSALAGGAAYAVPNALFAFRVVRSANKPDGASPHNLFVGQFVKILAVLVCLGGFLLVLGEWLVWPALLAGLIVVLKSYWILPWLGPRAHVGA